MTRSKITGTGQEGEHENTEEHDGDLVVPKFFAGILAVIIAGAFLGGAGWLIRVESRMAILETTLYNMGETLKELRTELRISRTTSTDK